ncbi:hypothetical protein [Kitasatospora viridis]|uniref:Uncharacterized protein n=1 Tax=Kitasatospora viridis TaxID=281105 RepID=A0A561S9Y2_9ACTN|nr:hypothetical protein [Kitasatospora viridis]TWF71689.1 hypothetical protein FHX73_1860 [Kitasatospora viridis]
MAIRPKTLTIRCRPLNSWLGRGLLRDAPAQLHEILTHAERQEDHPEPRFELLDIRAADVSKANGYGFAARWTEPRRTNDPTPVRIYATLTVLDTSHCNIADIRASDESFSPGPGLPVSKAKGADKRGAWTIVAYAPGEPTWQSHWLSPAVRLMPENKNVGWDRAHGGLGGRMLKINRLTKSSFGNTKSLQVQLQELGRYADTTTVFVHDDDLVKATNAKALVEDFTPSMHGNTVLWTVSGPEYDQLNEALAHQYDMRLHPGGAFILPTLREGLRSSNVMFTHDDVVSGRAARGLQVYHQMPCDMTQWVENNVRNTVGIAETIEEHEEERSGFMLGDLVELFGSLTRVDVGPEGITVQEVTGPSPQEEIAMLAEGREEILGELNGTLEELEDTKIQLTAARAEVEELRARPDTAALRQVAVAAVRDRDAANQRVVELEAEGDDQVREIAFLRRKLADLQKAPFDEAVPAARPVAASWDEFLEMGHELLEYVVLGDRVPDSIAELDSPHSALWINRAWGALEMLESYGQARATAGSDRPELSSIYQYLRWPGALNPISASAFVPDESAAVKARDEWFNARVFPVPRSAHPSERAYMGAHIRLGAQVPYPRLHLFDSTRADGKIHIGYIGPHLPNTLTAKM